MRAGGLKHPITILRRIQVGQTPIGEPNWRWQEWLQDIWSEVTPRRGKEQFDPTTKKRFSEVVWHFRVRFEEVIGVDETMEVEHEGNRFKIRSVLPDAQSRSDAIIECYVEDGAMESKPLMPVIEDMINLGVVGEAYQGFSVAASGGTGPYVFGASDLPPGLSLNSATGLVSGTPTTAGEWQTVFTVSDSETSETFSVDLTVEA